MKIDFDLATLSQATDHSTYARGEAYARRGTVSQVRWDVEYSALRGTVRGTHVYETSAFFSLTDGMPAKFEMGECSCPCDFNCKHVVALVLSALAQPSADAVKAAKAVNQQPPAWERSLISLLDADGTGQASATPLAIELALVDSLSQPSWTKAATPPAPLRLVARPVRPGKHGGWVSTGLSWGKLDTLAWSQEYNRQHVRLLRELYVLYQTCRARSGGYYGYYGDDRSIELSAVGSRQLWPLLDEFQAAGVRLVYPGKRGALGDYEEAEFCLDVTSSEAGELKIVPVVRRSSDGRPVLPVAFIGGEGHGVVCADLGQPAARTSGDWQFQIARLTRPVPALLQQLALGGESLQVPATEAARFHDRYYPKLRHSAALISSDGSFNPPEISGPDLVLRARYGSGHELELTWEWAYKIGDSPLRLPFEPGGQDDGYRDLVAERALLAELDLPPGAQVNPAASFTRLTGIDTMRFTTELLPLLTGQHGLIVEVTGEPADYREAGDSLRIAVSTDEVAGDTDWFDLGVTITVEGRPIPFLDVFLALSRGDQHLLLPDGAFFSLDKPEMRALARLIEEARSMQDTPSGSLRISRYQASFWEELSGLGIIGHQAATWQEQVQGLLTADGTGHAEPPGGLRAQLRPYQQDGFAWLTFLWKHRLGGILADDMGLGKTLQSLALISYARQRDPAAGPFLIVTPTSVIGNWAAEAARFTPDLKVVAITGTVTRMGQSLREIIEGADAVVTSYTLLRLDFTSYSGERWSGLLLDEAQQAKNRQSKVYQCARRLTAPVKIAITGTPLENNLMELWSLLSITAPGLFPNPDRFRDYYAKPVEQRADTERLAKLQRRIKPLIRRRTKEQVAADLPAKQEQILEVDLHPQHRKAYQTHLQRERQKVLGLIGDLNSNRFAIFRSLTLMRQLSLHAGLVDEAYANLACGKIDALVEKLHEVTGGGHRALVFSQFTGFLGKVRQRLDAEGIGYCYLDGSTRDRASVVRSFKEGKAPVFLISLKAGGFGLNLTEADYCFLLDPWWNPATEAQAVDRTHRIGQTRSVMVYRLVAKDTIEEKVMALKARKAKLFSSVMDEANVFGATLDTEDIRALICDVQS
ncbi:MAG TPA: SNF2-related protein [Streptosporangiaceae bacterium]|nr:SNF2-related protein [Streptosporangiaceae bacterium]